MENFKVFLKKKIKNFLNHAQSKSYDLDFFKQIEI